jgi:acyl-CoA synthetase (AMP-forming)/AMP-acid ligase II
MSEFRTIAEAVAGIGALYPERTFVFQDMRGNETTYRFEDLERDTARRAAGLQAMGLKKGDRFGLVIIEPEAFVLSFLAATRMGAIPVPLYPPLSFGSLDAYAEKTANILTNAEATLLIASDRLKNVLWSLVDQVPTLRKLVPVEDLAGVEGEPDLPEIRPEDLCFLQYTSGSTSDPKGVMVTHGNLIANCDAIIDRLGLSPELGDKGISWLPLYHDMGLIGHVLSPVVRAIPSVFIPTMRFIKRPSCWLETIHQHRGTTSFAPNFAYALVTKRARRADLERWDLSCLKVLGCGAEPINAETMRAFVEVYSEHCGLRKDAILPAYGMAEATLAMTLKPEDTMMVVRPVDAERFQAEGVAEPPASEDTAVDLHVSCGKALDRHEVAVFTEEGQRLPDGVEGELCFRGPSVMAGYFQNPEATATALRGEWLRTGDLGYISDGDVFVTGRLKDLIILNGRNIHPQTVEWEVAEVEGVRKGNVVAFSRPGVSSEELVVVLETKTQDRDALVEAVKHRVQREMSLAIGEVLLLGRGVLPKTSSGKLQRRRTRQLYLTGQLTNGGSRVMGVNADRVTLAKHVARSFWSRAKAAVLAR